MRPNSTSWQKRFSSLPLYLNLLLCLASLRATAQQKIYGNISIPAGAQITVFGTQDFQNGSTAGVIRTERQGSYGVLNAGTAATFINTGPKGYVDGYLRKSGSLPFIFPVGQDGFYGPFSANADKTTGAYFHTNPSSAGFTTSSKELSVSIVTGTEYWDIDAENATRITLTWNNLSSLDTFVPQLAKLTIVGWKDGKWLPIASQVDSYSILDVASSLFTGSITTRNPIIPNDFEAYTLAAVSESLPVTLLSFTARPENNTVLLNWKTSSETNSDRFEIERSKDGKAWQHIGTIKSMGESNATQTYMYMDVKPLIDQNLYRLKMMDADESFAYSNIRSVVLDQADMAFTVYPNPATTTLNIKSNLGVVDKGKIRVTDTNGRDYTGVLSWIDGHINIEKLANGLYILTVPNNTGNHIYSKFIVER